MYIYIYGYVKGQRRWAQWSVVKELESPSSCRSARGLYCRVVAMSNLPPGSPPYPAQTHVHAQRVNDSPCRVSHVHFILVLLVFKTKTKKWKRKIKEAEDGQVLHYIYIKAQLSASKSLPIITRTDYNSIKVVIVLYIFTFTL